MEPDVNRLQTAVSSKPQNNSTRSTRELPTKALHVLPTEENDIRSTHVNNCFPKGRPIKRSVASYGRRQSSVWNYHSSLVLINRRRPLYAERTMNLYMPRLTFDHSADTFINNTRTNCSFVSNSKMYMKKNGLNINELYSLKQSKRGMNYRKTFAENANMVRSPSVDIKTNNFSLKTKNLTAPYESSSFLQTAGARHSVTGSPVYARPMRELERETKITGHVRAADSTGNLLGKILTKTHLESLLTQEQPVIPPVFYMKSYW